MFNSQCNHNCGHLKMRKCFPLAAMAPALRGAFLNELLLWVEGAEDTFQNHFFLSYQDLTV